MSNDDCETMSVPAAGRKYFNLGRDGSYRAAKRGDILTITVGRLLRVPKRAMERRINVVGELPSNNTTVPVDQADPRGPANLQHFAINRDDASLRAAAAPPRHINRGNRETNKAGPLPTGTGLQFCSPPSRKNNQDDHT
jgi:hypothetical protein